MMRAKKNDGIREVIEASLGLHRIMRSRMMKLETLGLSIFQLHALLCIQEQPRMTMKQFARCLRVTSPSATAAAERLVRDGFLRRERDPDNRKLVLLRITPRGKSLVQKAKNHRDRALADVFSVIPAADQRTFARILRQVVSSHASTL